MSPHETLVTETREWLEHARADLDACAALIAAGLAAAALPPHGFQLSLFPVKWVNTTAAPVRAVAILQD